MSKKVENIFTVVNGASTPTILMSGYISPYSSINSADFKTAVDDFEKEGQKNVDILINTAGGSTFEGFTIGDYMENSPLKFHCIVVGMAASMGGVVLQFGNKRSAYKNARVMTHKAKGGQSGEADQLRSMADLIDQEQKKILDRFVQRTGKPVADVKKWFKPGVDKWFSATDAKELNIIDDIIEPKKTSNQIDNSIDDIQQLVNAYEPVINELLPNTETNNEVNTIMNTTNVIALMTQNNLEHSLTENSAETEVNAALENVFAKAAKADEYKGQLDKFKKDNAEAIVKNAIAKGVLKPNEKEQWVKDATDNPTLVTTALGRMTGKPNLNINAPVDNLSDEAEQHSLFKGREAWTYDKWQDEDPKGLETIHNEAKEQWEELFNKQYKK